jgi:hypothetical protein
LFDSQLDRVERPENNDLAAGAGTVAGWVRVAGPPGGTAGRPTARVGRFPRCADGLPPRILVDPGCPPDGVCGYTCAPGRWEPFE